MNPAAGAPQAALPPAHVLATVLRFRRAIVGVAVGVALLVDVVLLVLPRDFTSSASFIPTIRRSGGGLAGLAATLGVNLTGVDLSQSPQFYADLVSTPTILAPVVEAQYTLSDTTLPPVSLLDAYDIAEKTAARRRELGIKKFQDDLHVTLVQRTGLIRVEVTMKDPVLARQLVLRLLDELVRFNVQSRQSQAAGERRFTEQRVRESLGELREAENRLRDFLRANRDFRSSPDLKFEEDRLQREVSLRQRLYTSLAEAYETARIEEVRDTPLLTIVEPAALPAKPDSRGLLLKTLIALFASAAAAVFVVLARIAATFETPAADGGVAMLAEQWAGTREDLRHPLRMLRDTVQRSRRGQ